MTHSLKVKNIFFILLGSAILAFGLVHFNMQNNLAEGGFTGITLILYQLFHINPSYSNLLLNIPIFFIGWRFLGRTAFIYTLIGTIGLSVWLWIFERYSFHIPLENDLMRRDFTINALAYNDKLIDLFNGINDLNSKIIRSIGNSDKRFEEDALRIIRAIRFSCKLNFEIEYETKKSIHKNKELLIKIPIERINSELFELFKYINIDTKINIAKQILEKIFE